MKIVAETQESNPILQPHSNAVVPHTISDHSMAVQTSVMVDGKWVNLIDTNDIHNLDLDLHKVANVVQDEVSKIADVESNANSAVEQAELAQEASNANKTAIANMDSAVKAAQQGVSDTQTLLNQKAGELSSTITQVSNKTGQNTTLISNLTQTVDGIQSTVKSKADQSTVSQLANQVLAKVSTDDFQSEIALIQNDLNLRVSKGDVISQLNLEAGGDGLIQVANGKGKLYLDADSVVFSKKAFIPSAAITDIEADKIKSGTLDAGLMRVINLTADVIHGGTLDMGSMNVKNLSANDITTGTLEGVSLTSIKEDKEEDSFGNIIDDFKYVKIANGSIFMGKIDKNDESLINTDDSVAYTSDYLNRLFITPVGSGELDFNGDTFGFNTSWSSYGNDGLRQSALYISRQDDYSNAPIFLGTKTFGETGHKNSENNYGLIINGKTVSINLDGEGTESSVFNVQKDDHVGAYFGAGSDGNQINFASAGGSINFDTAGGSVNINDSLNVSGAKHSVVQTSQGWLAINAYETAEYYFGDIGESNTGTQSKVTIGIDRIFNETVNTNIQYQVCVTPYSDTHIWVEQRYNNRFIVCSDKPNAEFGWEIKAKRKGYEDNRLRKVDADFKPSIVLNKGDL